MKFDCPHCQQHFEADESFVGITMDCPVCGQSFVVPPPSAAYVETSQKPSNSTSGQHSPSPAEGKPLSTGTRKSPEPVTGSLPAGAKLRAGAKALFSSHGTTTRICVIAILLALAAIWVFIACRSSHRDDAFVKNGAEASALLRQAREDWKVVEELSARVEDFISGMRTVCNENLEHVQNADISTMLREWKSILANRSGEWTKDLEKDAQAMENLQTALDKTETGKKGGKGLRSVLENSRQPLEDLHAKRSDLEQSVQMVDQAVSTFALTEETTATLIRMVQEDLMVVGQVFPRLQRLVNASYALFQDARVQQAALYNAELRDSLAALFAMRPGLEWQLGQFDCDLAKLSLLVEMLRSDLEKAKTGGVDDKVRLLLTVSEMNQSVFADLHSARALLEEAEPVIAQCEACIALINLLIN